MSDAEPDRIGPDQIEPGQVDLDLIERDLRDVESSLARLADGTYFGTGAESSGPDPDATTAAVPGSAAPSSAPHGDT